MSPILPDIPAKVAKECVDPGVGSIATTADAVKVIGENRVYAACSNRQFRNLKLFYRSVKTNLGGK